MDHDSTTTEFYATVMNQYGLALGTGFGSTREEATAQAHVAANRMLAAANSNWKWRKAKTMVSSNPFKRLANKG